MTTIQDIFEMRKNGNYEEAYNAVLPMYKEHHGHYTTLCMFWTATDVMKIRIESNHCKEAERIFCALLQLYPNMQDSELAGGRCLNQLALMLARKEQDIAHNNPISDLHFSLLDYMNNYGNNFLKEDDWTTTEHNGHLIPSFGMQVISRIFHEIKDENGCSQERLQAALEMVYMGLGHTPHNKHMLRYQAYLTYRCGDKEKAIRQYRSLLQHSRDSYLFSELAAIVDNPKEQAALLAKAILFHRAEPFAQKDRISLALLVKQYFPQHAAYELKQVLALRESLGLKPTKAILKLQHELNGVVPVNHAEQTEFYKRLSENPTHAA